MKRKQLVKLFVGLILAMNVMSFTSYAKAINCNYVPDIGTESERLPRKIKESRDFLTAIMRGAFFSAADLKIFNSNGEIGVSGHSYMSDPVDELYMTIYVDRWIEKDSRWAQVAYYDFEFYAEDYPDGLTSETVEFIINNQPKDNYYRLRGSYAAIKDGAMEGFGPVTDGVLIE